MGAEYGMSHGSEVVFPLSGKSRTGPGGNRLVKLVSDSILGLTESIVTAADGFSDCWIIH